MAKWPSCKARQVLRALRRIGWVEKRQVGSHRTLAKPGWHDVTFAFHDNDEIGPTAMKWVAEDTGLTQDDL
jgi:predicted RNA binding protein YcfA (HicA-like mRNA interferase family)